MNTLYISSSRPLLLRITVMVMVVVAAAVVRKARGGRGRLWGKKLKSSFAPLARENRSTSGGGCTGANDAFASCCRKTSRPRSQPTYPRRITTRVSKTFHYSYTHTHTYARTHTHTRGPCCSSIRVGGDRGPRRFFMSRSYLYTRTALRARRKIDLTVTRKDFLPKNSPL